MRKRRRIFKHHSGIYLFLAPSLLGLGVFYVAPFFISMYYAVIEGAVSNKFVGLANLINTWHNQAFITASQNTILFMAANIPLNMGLALLFAMLLKPLPTTVRRVLIVFFLLPLVIPSASITFFWNQFLSINGMLNRGWVSLLKEMPIDWLNSPYAMVYMVLIFLWKNIGFNIILFQAGLNFIPKDYYEYAEMEGAGKIRQFFIVTFTYLGPSFLLVFIMSVVNSFKVFREIYLLTGAVPNSSIYLLQHFINNQFAHLNYQRMASASFFIFVSLFLLVLVIYRLQQRQTYY